MEIKKSIKHFLLSRIVTPTRARKAIASIVSWLLYKCVVKGTWDVISSFPKWLRKLADFIERWNDTELTVEKDKLIADLVADAVTDEAVDRLIDSVSAMEADCK